MLGHVARGGTNWSRRRFCIQYLPYFCASDLSCRQSMFMPANAGERTGVGNIGSPVGRRRLLGLAALKTPTLLGSCSADSSWQMVNASILPQPPEPNGSQPVAPSKNQSSGSALVCRFLVVGSATWWRAPCLALAVAQDVTFSTAALPSRSPARTTAASNERRLQGFSFRCCGRDYAGTRSPERGAPGAHRIRRGPVAQR